MTEVVTTLGEKLRAALEKKSNGSEPSVLATTIKHWDDEDNERSSVKDIPVRTIGLPMTTEKTNTSRITFDFVRDNSGMFTVNEIGNILETQGQKKSTVLSLLYQMIRSDTVYKTDSGRIGTKLEKYTPLKNSVHMRKLEQSEAKEAPRRVINVVRRTADAGIAALQEAPARVDAYKWNADDYIGGLGVLQARELHLKLKEIFGG